MLFRSVGNAARLEKEDLRDSFVQFGDIRDVWIARNPPGFGFVTFYKEEDAEKAIREGNGMEIRGDRVTVELARSTGDRSSRRYRSYSRGRYSRSRSYSRHHHHRSRSHSRSRRSRRHHSRSYSSSDSRDRRSSRRSPSRSRSNSRSVSRSKSAEKSRSVSRSPSKSKPAETSAPASTTTQA